MQVDYKLKRKADDNVERYKPRLVARGSLKNTVKITKKLSPQCEDNFDSSCHVFGGMSWLEALATRCQKCVSL